MYSRPAETQNTLVEVTGNILCSRKEVCAQDPGVAVIQERQTE